MKRGVALLVVAGLVSVVALSAAQPAPARRTVTIASGSVDGVYYPIAGAISRITSDARISTSAPPSSRRAARWRTSSSFARARPTSRSSRTTSPISRSTASGSTAFAGKPVKGMAGVFSVYPELMHIVATHASGVKSAHDLKGKRVALGPRGSATEQNALQTLAAHGIREGDLRAAVRVSFSASADQLKAGVVDAAFFVMALGAPVIVDAFNSGKVALVPVSTAPAEALLGQFPFFTMGEIPARTYKGQDRELATPAVMAMVVARSGLSDDLVYRFTRVVFDNLPQFHASHVAARSLTLQTALVGMALPLHPGAERFFKEKGIAR